LALLLHFRDVDVTDFNSETGSLGSRLSLFPSVSSENSGIVTYLKDGHDQILPHSLQYTIHNNNNNRRHKT